MKSREYAQGTGVENIESESECVNHQRRAEWPRASQPTRLRCRPPAGAHSKSDGSVAQSPSWICMCMAVCAFESELREVHCGLLLLICRGGGL